MSYQITIREEELKNSVAHDYFDGFDTRKIIGDVDFCVSVFQSDKTLFEQQSLLWAEAKKGISDIHNSLVQLILTIGKARTFDKFLPPSMLGAFDAEKIAFIPYNSIHDIFYINDFNWNVTPSNHESKEFKLVLQKVKRIFNENTRTYFYDKDDTELKNFIKKNFVVGNFGFTKTRIDKNNFIAIYNKWLHEVKPTIVANWEIVKKNGIIDGDFYLADLLSLENVTLKDKLSVVLKNNIYELDRQIDELGFFSSRTTTFTDNQKAHTQFWNKYERPPLEQYWDYIIERRDLLVPQDIRERKGSFFTPQIWVELSQKYLADALGVDWQDEYYVWDCAAGTGNLLSGLTNKYHVWASTLDKQDVDVMHDRIKNGANLLDNHVFQFDFLNDDFSKLPESLQNIINNPDERKKLIIYINPPYAEATTARTISGTGKNKTGVATENKLNQYFNSKIGNASNEVFALFMAQVYEKIPDAYLALFSKLKFIQGSNFARFKDFFLAKFLGGFIVPANSFDNVKGQFPIGFTIWDTKSKQKIKKITCDIYKKDAQKHGEKLFFGNLGKSINKWLVKYQSKTEKPIGLLSNYPPDFQNNNKVFIQIVQSARSGAIKIEQGNLIPISIYFAVRHCIKAGWLNDRDQFLYPNKKWEKDTEFQNDCLAFTLFHGQNRISSGDGINHWIPFSENEVNANEKFKSNFMSKFLNGKLKIEDNADLYNGKIVRTSEKLSFSPEAKAVFDAGKALWIYYHAQPDCNVNASLYDIRSHFQGRNSADRMKSKSTDEQYTQLVDILRDKLTILALKIEPKVYEYEFLT